MPTEGANIFGKAHLVVAVMIVKQGPVNIHSNVTIVHKHPSLKMNRTGPNEEHRQPYAVIIASVTKNAKMAVHNTT